MGSPLLDAVAERVLVYDGAMGTQLQALGLTAADFAVPTKGDPKLARVSDAVKSISLEGCNELLCLSRPDLVQEVHASYLEAGCDLIETNSFGTTSIVLQEYGLQDLVFELALAAAQVARKAVDAVSTAEKPRFVVGAIGPGTKLISLSQATWTEVETTYHDAFLGLLTGGADALLLETLQDLLLAKAAVLGATRAMDEFGVRVPLFVQVTMEQTGTMLLGSEIGAALNMLEAFPQVISIGINCATGPVEMAPHIRFLGQQSTRPISVQPNAGLPQMKHGKAVYQLTPDELAQHQSHFMSDFGVAMIGGCCGTTPEHIRALAELADGRSHTAPARWIQTRHLFPGFDFRMKNAEQDDAISLVGCSSLFAFQRYEQDQSFLIVGEKTNANGSKAFRTMLDAENWEGLAELAREQEAEGSHLLDVCTAFVGRNEERDMRMLLAILNKQVTVPMMIDSTEWPVIEAALQTIAGKPLVNSINFEDGGERADRVLDLCAKYGAGVVALTIDEVGMAKTLDQKVAIADRLLEATRAHGLPDHDVFIDALTFTLGSGDEEFRGAGIATLEAIRAIRLRHPRVNTILGVSNISFGLKPAIRQIVNSAFLHFAREAGLTSAIVQASKIVPESKVDPDVWTLASDLVFDRRTFQAES